MDFTSLPVEMQCQIFSNLTNPISISNFITSNQYNLLAAQSYITHITADTLQSHINPRLIVSLPKLSHVSGTIKLTSLSDMYLIATHPSLKSSIFYFNVPQSNEFFMIHQFILTYLQAYTLNLNGLPVSNSKSLSDTYFLFQQSDDTDDNYIFIADTTLFFNYRYEDYAEDAMNLLIYLLQLQHFTTIYLDLDWPWISKLKSFSHFIDLLNSLSNPINIMIRSDVLTDAELDNTGYYAPILSQLKRVNLVLDENHSISVGDILPVGGQQLEVLTGHIHPQLYRGGIEDFPNLHTIGRDLFVDDDTPDTLSDSQLSRVIYSINKIPSSITTIYVYTDNNVLLNNPPTFPGRKVIFTRPNVMSFDSNIIFSQYVK